jgi:PBSX family phage terminase large subunit
MTENDSRVIKLYSQQYDFFVDESNFTAFIAGIGSGKTYVGSLLALSQAKPNTLGLICSPSYRMLRDSTLRTFMSLAEPYILEFNKTDMIMKIRGGGEILFRSTDDPDKLRGPNLNWGWIDEGGLTHPDTWMIMIGRLRADRKFGKCWTTSTPKGKRNWLYEQSELMSITRATTLDNPYVSKEWKNSVLNSYSGKFLQQEIYGDFVSFEGLVYEFDRSIHVKTRPETDFVNYGFGVDEGYTHPTVILKICTDNDGRYHVAEEWYKTGKLQSEVVEQAVIMDAGKRKDFVVDSSAAGLIASLRDAGVNARKRTGRVLDGIGLIQDLLVIKGDGKPRLTVDPSCVNLINEFETYVWKDDKDEPVKEYDHALDALRYYVKRSKVSISSQAKIGNYMR